MVFPGIPPVFFSQPSNNPGLTLGNFLPISALTGLPQGGNIVNFPIAAGQFGTPAGIAFGFLSRKININLVLDALEAQNKTTSLAKPEVVTVENAKAIITLGSEIPNPITVKLGSLATATDPETTGLIVTDGTLTHLDLEIDQARPRLVHGVGLDLERARRRR